jgi:8-oxo-dGTP pyrophosphatase MutT (NUDIX family)
MEYLHKDKFICLKEDHGWQWASRTNDLGVVSVLARTLNNEYVLVSQFRRPVGKYVLEPPAGLIDRNETPEHAARRELYEETGYRGTLCTKVAELPSSAGMTDETTHLFIITECVKDPAWVPDPKEPLVVVVCNTDEVDKTIADHVNGGSLICPRLYAALYFMEKLWNHLSMLKTQK